MSYRDIGRRNPMRQPMRVFFVLLALAALLAGCGRLRPEKSAARPRNLTPTEYQLLKDEEKVRYKDIIVRVPASWGGALLPFDKGPYPSPVEKAIHAGDLNTLMGLY